MKEIVVFSEKLNKNILIDIDQDLTDEEQLDKIIGLSNSVTTG